MIEKLIEMDGKFYQKAYPILLESKEGLFQKWNNNELYIPKSPKGGVKRLDLYILSDEDIKEGGWGIINDSIFNILSIKGFNCEIRYLTDEIKTIPIESLVNAKKIIATTDKSLTKQVWSSDGKTLMAESEYPRPSNDFLAAYVKAQGKGFEEVLVEMGSITNTRNHTEKYPVWFLKVNPDNTIVIKPFKEEIYNLTRSQLKNEFLLLIKQHFISFSDEYGMSGWNEFDKWFDKNY